MHPRSITTPSYPLRPQQHPSDDAGHGSPKAFTHLPAGELMACQITMPRLTSPSPPLPARSRSTKHHSQCLPTLTRNPKQTILQALQSQPPRPPPQRQNRLLPLRSHKRSLQHPRQRDEKANLRPRLPARLATSLCWTPKRQLQQRLHPSRRQTSLRPQPTTDAIQRPAALVLPIWRLGLAR